MNRNWTNSSRHTARLCQTASRRLASHPSFGVVSTRSGDRRSPSDDSPKVLRRLRSHFVSRRLPSTGTLQRILSIRPCTLTCSTMSHGTLTAYFTWWSLCEKIATGNCPLAICSIRKRNRRRRVRLPFLHNQDGKRYRATSGQKGYSRGV